MQHLRSFHLWIVFFFTLLAQKPAAADTTGIKAFAQSFAQKAQQGLQGQVYINGEHRYRIEFSYHSAGQCSLELTPRFSSQTAAIHVNLCDADSEAIFLDAKNNSVIANGREHKSFIDELRPLTQAFLLQQTTDLPQDMNYSVQLQNDRSHHTMKIPQGPIRKLELQTIFSDNREQWVSLTLIGSQDTRLAVIFE